MFFYAMADTHFLLYIFDNLRNELVERSNPTIPEGNKIELVLQRSKETSLFRFERQIYDEDTGMGPGGWYNLLVKSPALFTNEQFAVFRAIHAWRDKIARKDDDSISYVMPNHVVFTLARLMPTDMVSLYGAVHPISPNVKSRTAELLALIKSAKERGKEGPSMMGVLRPDSIGATVKATSPSVALGPAGLNRTIALNLPTVSTQLRTNKSIFWGGAFGSSVWDLSSRYAGIMDLNLAVIMPHLASEIGTESIDGMMDRSPLQDGQNQAQALQASRDRVSPDEEEAFVIKRGKKWKIRATEGEPMDLDVSSKEYDISLNDDEEDKTRAKAARKAARKAQKKLEKAARKLARAEGTEAIEPEGQDDEPFDYSNADSLLHKKRNDTAKSFDPYTKSSNAPKGMRKLQTERSGKSYTFKS
jgi:exosome complex exonuclease RRP6